MSSLLPTLLGSLVASVLTFAPAQPADDSSYAAALAEVEAANVDVNRDPKGEYPALEAAVERLTGFAPQLAGDEAGRELLALALLNLARARLLDGDEAGAAAKMDEAIRFARGRELPIDRFGPTLAEFHEGRRNALKAGGRGEIQVDCATDCVVLIDGQSSGASSGPLYLGSYRVYVEDSEGKLGAERHEINLDQSGEVVTIAYPRVAAEPAERRPLPVVRDSTSAPGRILPRWAEISVMVVGASALAAGGVLLGFDGRCPGGLDPVADAADCPEVYESSTSGFVALGLGAALLATGTVVLTIDEVRGARQRGTRAMLSWQMRF